LKALILIGARDAGKTQTLGKTRNDGLKKSLHHEKDGRLFSRKGKLLQIYISSCQEQVRFCFADDVADCIEREIARAKENNADLLVLPFTVRRNRSGILNIDCIKRALDTLKARGIVATLVYLQRADVPGGEEIDAFVKSLNPLTVLKSEEKYEKQASKLLQVADDLLL